MGSQEDLPLHFSLHRPFDAGKLVCRDEELGRNETINLTERVIHFVKIRNNINIKFQYIFIASVSKPNRGGQ